ncbi:MAG: tetratricopeptide repeat protein, partial [Asticcacaulis sp.]
MIRRFTLSALVLMAATALAAGTVSAQDVDPNADLGKFRALRDQGMKALDAQDASGALDAFTRAETILPDSPSILLLKAQAYLAQNRKAEARAAVVDYEKRGYLLDLKKNPDFAAVWDSDLDAMQAANTAKTGDMHVAMTLPGFLLGQGIAYAGDGDHIYVSGVHDGSITVLSAAGAKPLMSFRPGVAAYGMGVHDGSLWAVTAASRQTSGYDPKAKTASKVVVINPANGAVVNSFADTTKDRSFGALLAGKDDLYVADSAHGEVLRLNGYKGKFQTLVPEGYFDSPQGLAENADGTVLIVSDFIAGLYRVDLVKGSFDHLSPPSDGSLLGLSHLSRYGNDLIAVETGFKPNRIVRLHMSPDWSKVEKAEVLLRSPDDLSQPTAGLVDGDHYVFIAKSQWDNLDDRGNAKSTSPDPVVIGAL